MNFTINGQIQLDKQTFYRIDDLDSGLTGIDFLRHPAALVQDRQLAERIVKLLNADEKERSKPG
ncbi:MAG TPA: hypothetical protein VK797_23155 [Tepidisphaeraceae bacterium]|jgi:hypothetical protein|nr:hypothetical protein [Tepidisphaeraceae bacterium]